MTVLELDPPLCRREGAEYVSMTVRRDERLVAGTEQRRRYLEVLRAQSRSQPAPLALPVRPVIGRGQVESAPEEVKAIVPAYNRPRRRRLNTI